LAESASIAASTSPISLMERMVRLRFGEDRREQHDQLRERHDLHREGGSGRLIPVVVIRSA
jgi:hypothetical protein